MSPHGHPRDIGHSTGAGGHAGAVALAVGGTLGSALWAPASADTQDLAFTPVSPCVVFDSRAAVRNAATGGFLGPIDGGQAVTYQVAGTFPAAQGGGSTTCGVPMGAAGGLINDF